MGQKVNLREICHARSGDKGADFNIGIAVYDPEHYSWLEDHLIFEMALWMPCNGPTGSTWSWLIEGGGAEKVTSMYSTPIPQEDFHPVIVEI